MMQTGLDSEPMIAGKTRSEILSMKRHNRCYWYNKILPEEKEKAMKIVDIAGRAKNSAAKMGGNHPLFGKHHTDKSKAKASATLKDRPKSEKTKAKMSAAKTRENHPNWQGGKSFLPYCYLFNEKKKEEVRNRYGRVCILTDTLRSVMGPESGLDDFAGHEIFSGRRLSVHHIRGNKMAGCDGTELALIPLQCAFNNKKSDGLRLEDHSFYITLFLLKDIERRYREEMLGSKLV